MKKIKFMLVVSLVIVSISACTIVTGNTSEEGFDFSDEEMVFSKDEGAAANPEPGFDFTEDEIEDMPSESGFDFTEDDNPGDVPGSDPANDNDDDQNMQPENDSSTLPSTAEHIYPPEGVSNWVINYDEGTITCPNMTIPFEKSLTETINIELGAEAASLVVKDMDETQELFFFLMDSGPGGSQYDGWYTVPNTDEEIHYEMVFTNLSDPNSADYIIGNISATSEGCQVSRSFGGARVD